MRRVHVAAWLGIAAIVGGVAEPARGQDQGDVAAFFALLLTPTGALPPVVRAPMLQGAPDGSTFQARYGRYEFDGADQTIHNIGLGADLRAGAGWTGVTVALQTCDGCDGTILLGLDYTTPLVQLPIGADQTVRNTSVLSVALTPSAGLSRPLDSDANVFFISGSVALPVSISTQFRGATQLVPFLAPGFGIGLIAGEGDTESGVRFMLGGGLGVAGLGPGLGITVGFQKIFIEGGPTQWGLGLTFREVGQASR